MKQSTEPTENDWTIANAEDYEGRKRWGGGHFSVDEDGFMLVHPSRDQRSFCMYVIFT